MRAGKGFWCVVVPNPNCVCVWPCQQVLARLQFSCKATSAKETFFGRGAAKHMYECVAASAPEDLKGDTIEALVVWQHLLPSELQAKSRLAADSFLAERLTQKTSETDKLVRQ